MRISFYLTISGRSPVERFIEGLPKADRGKFVDVLNGIIAHGLEYERAEFRHLKGKLWEIKFRALGGGYRVIYVRVDEDEMVWLHAFKKDSQKAPKEDLDLAHRRMKELP